MSRWRVLVAGGVLALLATGCSFAFVRPPSSQEARRSGQPVTCTTDTLAPALDVVFTAARVSATSFALSNSDEDYRDATYSRSTLITIGLLTSALGLSSAIYGFNGTAECRAALGIESSRDRTRPHSRDVAAEIAEEEAAQARAAALAAEQAKAAGEAAQRSVPAGSSTDAGTPR